MTRPRIGIIGGGITGLTAAYRLKQAGCDVTIFEASGDLGGLASGFTLAGHPVEKAYHFLYKTDQYILALVDELGLTDKLSYNASSVSTYYDGTLYPMMSPVDLIKFTPISFINRIRAGVTVLWLQRVKNWRSLSTITALDWLRKYAGRQVSDVIWEPLLKGKFDRYYDKVTMSWLWGRVKQRVDSRDAKVGGEALGYFDGGFKIIIDALLARIQGVDIRTNTKVANLKHEGGQVVVTTAAGEERFDRVLATVPSNALATMIAGYEQSDPTYFAKLRSIDYLDACVQVFATPQKFTPYYWHNINSPNAPFVVFLSLTNLVGSEKYGGLNIYYIGDYIPSEHRYMSMDPAELKQLWYGELKKIFPEFDPSQVVEDGLFRLRNAQHIVDIGFEENKLLPHETPCPGVLMCNFSQIYPMDRGTNYAVRDGNRMAEKLMASIEGREERETGPTLTEEATGGGSRRSGGDAKRRVSPLLIALALLLVGGGALGAGIFGGYEVATRQLPGNNFLARVDRKLADIFNLDRGTVEDTIATSLLYLQTDIGRAGGDNRDPTTGERLNGAGGGLTSFGEDVLVLPYDGRIRAARSGSEIRETRIQGPETNRAAYLRVADDPQYRGRYTFGRAIIRYNDLQYYNTGAEQGLLASYVEFHAEELCYTNTLARLRFDPSVTSIDAVSAEAGDWQVLHRTTPCLPLKEQFLAIEGHMAGGRLAFEAPSTVYMTSGDFHWDGMRSNTELISQNPTAEYGKVLSIDLTSGASRIVSMGHRNMQGIVIDPQQGLLVAEHGPRGGDELNRVREGANYGWPLETYGTTYERLRIPSAVSFGRHDTYEAPIYSWVPSVGISAITRIQGFNEAWDGDLLAGSLIGQSLFRIRFQGYRVVYVEPIRIGARIRDIQQHTDGRIALLTEDDRVIFLTPAARQAEEIFVADYVQQQPASVREPLNQAIATCTQCHSFVAGEHTSAPSLARVFKSDIAGTPFANYSDGLRNRNGRWNREALEAFLDDPQGFAPGTTMPDPAIDDPRTREELVNMLEEMRRSF